MQPYSDPFLTLFRHFYGLRWFTEVKGFASRGVDRPYGAVVGVLQTVLQIIQSENRDNR